MHDVWISWPLNRLSSTRSFRQNVRAINIVFHNFLSLDLTSRESQSAKRPVSCQLHWQFDTAQPQCWSPAQQSINSQLTISFSQLHIYWYTESTDDKRQRSDVAHRPSVLECSQLYVNHMRTLSCSSLGTFSDFM